MRSSVVFFLAFLTAVVNAHFELQFPPPRGPTVDDKENLFCDGYAKPAENRTRFPLKGGFVTLSLEHSESWVAGIYVSTFQNPTNFKDFILHKNFITGTKPGDVCIPLDFSKNSTGLTVGQDITIQVLWDGGDGPLNQCADVSLSNSVDLSKIECKKKLASSSGQALAANVAKYITFLVGLVALALLF